MSAVHRPIRISKNFKPAPSVLAIAEHIFQAMSFLICPFSQKLLFGLSISM